MLVVLESPQKLVIFIELSIGRRWGLRHIEVPIVQLLPPEGDGLLFGIMFALWEKLPQLFVGGDLLAFVEAVVSLEILIDVLEWNFASVLVVHDSSPDDIFGDILD